MRFVFAAMWYCGMELVWVARVFEARCDLVSLLRSREKRQISFVWNWWRRNSSVAFWQDVRCWWLLLVLSLLFRRRHMER